MHTLEQYFGIISFDGGVKYINKKDILTTDASEAKQFSSMAEAKTFMVEWFNRKSVFRDEQDTYSVVPLVGHEVKPHPELPSLPPPDFYEVGTPTTAEYIISVLSNDNFAASFIPVDNINGSSQMQAGVSTDPHDDRAVARSAKFSFPGWMEQDEIVKLRESATRHGQWKNLRIVNRGNGFAKWFIVILSQDLR
jgi:hypothetical protein